MFKKNDKIRVPRFRIQKSGSNERSIETAINGIYSNKDIQAGLTKLQFKLFL